MHDDPAGPLPRLLKAMPGLPPRLRDEAETVRALLAETPPAAPGVGRRARALIEHQRAVKPGLVAGVLQGFPLSAPEGVALMRLAEAMRRTPDAATRDRLIAECLDAGDFTAAGGNRRQHGAMLAGLALGLAGRLVRGAKIAAPPVRLGVDRAMALLGDLFIAGTTIARAVAAAGPLERGGFTHSYDMLGEAAMTAADADAYFQLYREAIGAIGAASAGRGPVAGPGVSIKLSALHPRYSRLQRDRVMAELLPRLRALAVLARAQDVGFTIDAEEADRLDLSLELITALAEGRTLAGWNGLGAAVQAYQMRAPEVIERLAATATGTGRRLMVRLVKGAYWDSEIKHAQEAGLAGFPVFTRKAHTDLCYLACARRMVAAGPAIYPQFATHNAQTVAAVLDLAGEQAPREAYEFQCLHGMGGALYDQLVASRACRVYAPVGGHATLLAYLVRRLLENGANSSFVNQIADASTPIEGLIQDPASVVRARVPIGAPHPGIAAPADLFGPRRNAVGVDLADETVLAWLAADLAARATMRHRAGASGAIRSVINPADAADIVGQVAEAGPAEIEAALAAATLAAPAWAAAPAERRADCLRDAADRLEARTADFISLLNREAGRTVPNAIGEIREAVDFLRYYADQAGAVSQGRPLGCVVCISPWNFPLAIFLGQISAALAAGNVVLAKPAEQTPLIAAAALALLHEVGIPAGALHLLPGGGEVGAALVADHRAGGVAFTGSNEVAKRIAAVLAGRLRDDGQPVPFIAETGGQNALVVDSTALPEQVVADVVASAFDSAGQRCSAARVLCLQTDIAERVLTMLRGAMAELRIGDPGLLATDIGPVIEAAAAHGIEAAVATMAARGHQVHRTKLPADLPPGHYVAPALIEIGAIADLRAEVFGPVLHVLRYPPADLDRLIDDIEAAGYGLTFGLHTRLDDRVETLLGRVRAGNVYVNRNMIGAVVGSQPFGGRGLSGTGPKAGGPLTLRRLLAVPPTPLPLPRAAAPPEAARAWCDWLAETGDPSAARCQEMLAATPVFAECALPGPAGERNRYRLRPRGRILCLASTPATLHAQIGAALATGNHVVVGEPLDLPATLGAAIEVRADWRETTVDAVLFAGPPAELHALQQALAAQPGPVVPVLTTLDLAWLVQEQSICINTAAAGGNAALLTLSEGDRG